MNSIFYIRQLCFKYGIKNAFKEALNKSIFYKIAEEWEVPVEEVACYAINISPEHLNNMRDMFFTAYPHIKGTLMVLKMMQAAKTVYNFNPVDIIHERNGSTNLTLTNDGVIHFNSELYTEEMITLILQSNYTPSSYLYKAANCDKFQESHLYMETVHSDTQMLMMIAEICNIPLADILEINLNPNLFISYNLLIIEDASLNAGGFSRKLIRVNPDFSTFAEFVISTETLKRLVDSDELKNIYAVNGVMYLNEGENNMNEVVN